MRRLNLVGVSSMAFLLLGAIFSAACGDETTDEGGGGSGTTTTTTTTSGSGGAGGGGEGGAGGGATACVPCLAALTGQGTPDQLCESSAPLYAALTECICTACGAADGDVCYTTCTTDEDADDACNACGQMAATAADGACKTQGDACIGDMGM
jgi:hypothetical protein